LKCRTLQALIREERSAAKEYDKRGLHSLAKDERKHARILSRKNCER
jgi:hypothetical protein